MVTLYKYPKHYELYMLTHLELSVQGHLTRFSASDYVFSELKKLVVRNETPHEKQIGLPKNAQFPCLEDLELKGYNLHKEIPNWLKNASSLKRLVLTNCNLYEFPEFVLNFPNLEFLDLGYNPFIFLPDAVFQLPKLKHLGFGNHAIEGKPFWIEHPKAPKQFIAQLAKAPHIKSLSLFSYPFVPKGLGKLSHLEALTLGKPDSGLFFPANKNEDKYPNFSGDTYYALLTDENFERLADFFTKLANFPNLANIRLLNLDIPTYLLDILAKIPSLRALQVLESDNLTENNNKLRQYDWSKFVQLQTLSLDFEMYKCPTHLKRLPNLENLEIFNFVGDSFDIPDSFPKLQNLRLIITDPYNKGKTSHLSDKFIRLLGQVQHAELQGYEGSLGLKIITEIQTLLKTYPADNQLIISILSNQKNKQLIENKDKLFAYAQIPLAGLDLQAWKVLLEYLNAPKRLQNLGLDTPKSYFLVASSKKWADLTQMLAQIAWTACKESDKADVLILEQCPPQIPDCIDWKKAVSASGLRLLVEKKQGFERLDADLNQQLIHFLCSGDLTNLQLGLDMLLKTYSPDQSVDTCLMAWGLLSKNRKIRKAVDKIVQDNWSPKLLSLYLLHRQHKTPPATVYELLKKSDCLDTPLFMNVAAFISALESRTYEHFACWDVLKTGGIAMPEAIRMCSGNSSELRLEDDFFEYPDSFLEALAHNSQITEISLMNPNIDFQARFFRIRKQIQSLHINTFDKRCRIHPDISRLQSLKMLSLSADNLQKQAPDSIAAFKDLENFNTCDNWSAQLPDACRAWTKLKVCSLYMTRLQSLPDWLGEWSLLESLAIETETRLDFSPLAALQHLQNLSIQSYEKHRTDWANVRLDLSKLTELSINICSKNQKHSLESFNAFINACSPNLESIFYADTNLAHIPNFWDKFPNLKTVELSGNFKSVARNTQPVLATYLIIYSHELESLDLDWELFPNLESISGYDRVFKQPAIQKSIPKHIITYTH